jgi:hypothetical protein
VQGAWPALHKAVHNGGIAMIIRALAGQGLIDVTSPGPRFMVCSLPSSQPAPPPCRSYSFFNGSCPLSPFKLSPSSVLHPPTLCPPQCPCARPPPCPMCPRPPPLLSFCACKRPGLWDSSSCVAMACCTIPSTDTVENPQPWGDPNGYGEGTRGNQTRCAEAV